MVMLCKGSVAPGLQCSLHTELMCAAHSAAVDVVGQAVVCHGGGGLVQYMLQRNHGWATDMHANGTDIGMLQICACFRCGYAKE